MKQDREKGKRNFVLFWGFLSVRNTENTEREDNWTKVIFEEIMIYIFLNTIKYVKLQIQVIS